MKLHRIRVQNFRAFDEPQTVSFHDYTTLVGPNNSGKSSILRALEILVGGTKPAEADWHGGVPTARSIEIEGEFVNVTDDEARIPGIAGIVCDGRIELRVVATWDDEARSVSVRHEARKSTILSAWPTGKWSDLPEDVRILAVERGLDGTAWRTNARKSAFVTWVMEERPNLIELGPIEWTADNISIGAALQQGLPQVVTIPAVRDAEAALKTGGKTAFGQLLTSVLLPQVQGSEEYRAVLDALEQLKAKLAGDGCERLEAIAALEQRLSASLSQVMSNAAVAAFGLTSPDIDKPLASSFSLSLDDGTRTPITHQGHGMQSALVFALLDAVAHGARQREGANGARPVLLLYEEPEIYLHPQLMRRLKSVLTQLASGDGWQVVITTHSPFLIDVADTPQSIAILRRERRTNALRVRQLEQDPFEGDNRRAEERARLRAALDFHPSVCEAFFARHAVLVEGDTEVAVLRHSPELVRAAGVGEAATREVTIVSCGGKWTIPPVARLLRALQIDFRVIHDTDRRGRSDVELDETEAIDPWRANRAIAELVEADSLYRCEDSVEHLLWEGAAVPTSSTDKPFRAFRRAATIVDADPALSAYPRVRELVRFAYDVAEEQRV